MINLLKGGQLRAKKGGQFEAKIYGQLPPESGDLFKRNFHISRTTQLDYAIPASKISSLSSGEFVGMVADDPQEKIKLKAFHAEIINDAEKLNKEVANYKSIPSIMEVTPEQIMDNYYQVKLDVKQLIEKEVNKLKVAELKQ